MEQGGLAYMEKAVSDLIVVETADGNTRELQITGTVQDLNQPVVQMSGSPAVFVTLDTRELLMSDLVGSSLLQSPLTYVFSHAGAFIWLFLILLISAVASYIPARNASGMSVWETLAYE